MSTCVCYITIYEKISITLIQNSRWSIVYVANVMYRMYQYAGIILTQTYARLPDMFLFTTTQLLCITFYLRAFNLNIFKVFLQEKKIDTAVWFRFYQPVLHLLMAYILLHAQENGIIFAQNLHSTLPLPSIFITTPAKLQLTSFLGWIVKRNFK